MRHPLAKDLELKMRKVTMLLRKNTKSILVQHDITLPQYYALIQLRDQSLTMGELCCRLFLASSTVTDLIDRMENQELVRRVRVENDRRSIRIELLAGGRQIIDRVIEDRLDFLSMRLNKIAEDKIETLIQTTAELITLMEEN